MTTMTRKTVAPNHAELLGRPVVATFGSGRRVPGRVSDTTVTNRGTVCVSIDSDLLGDADCDGVWTSDFEMV